jgi:hypothetical protein
LPSFIARMRFSKTSFCGIHIAVKGKVMNKKLFWLFTLLFLAAGTFTEAQQTKKVRRIGFLTLIPNPDLLESVFLQGLRDLGYEDGRNITIEYRRAAGKVESLA